MSETAPIIYRAFWDVPLVFVVRHKGLQLLFDCGEFDEELDDYPDTYKIFVLPNLTDEKVNRLPGAGLCRLATRALGEVPVKNVIFDARKRKEINTAILDEVLSRS